MHSIVFEAFNEICRQLPCDGAVLEVGATGTPDTLLNLPALASACKKEGINIELPTGDSPHHIIHCNANHMECFEDGEFDLVLCNSTLEHDPCFWKSVAEIRRVLRAGGWAVIGVPGFAELPGERMFCWLAALFDLFSLAPQRIALRASTATLRVHNYPGDYYRFSPQAMRQVLLEGLTDPHIRQVMVPPRIIGWGRKAWIA